MRYAVEFRDGKRWSVADYARDPQEAYNIMSDLGTEVVRIRDIVTGNIL